MKTLVRSLFLAAALFGTASADAKKPAEKAPKTEKAPEKKAELSAKEVEAYLAFFNKFVDTVVGAKEDCAKLTKDVNALIDANQPMIKKIHEYKAANMDLPQSAKDKMMARVKEMMPAMQKCGADPAFQSAMRRMENKPAGKTEKAAEKAPAPAKPAPKK